VLTGDGGSNVLRRRRRQRHAGRWLRLGHGELCQRGIGRDGEPGDCRAQNTVGAGSDTLIGMENLIGSSFNDVLTGRRRFERAGRECRQRHAGRRRRL
jgi:hypothetical protein